MLVTQHLCLVTIQPMLVIVVILQMGSSKPRLRLLGSPWYSVIPTSFSSLPSPFLEILRVIKLSQAPLNAYQKSPHQKQQIYSTASILNSSTTSWLPAQTHPGYFRSTKVGSAGPSEQLPSEPLQSARHYIMHFTCLLHLILNPYGVGIITGREIAVQRH